MEYPLQHGIETGIKEEAPNFERGLSFKRVQLPQVKLDDLLKDPNLQIIARRVDPAGLKPTQTEFNYDKVGSIINSGNLKAIITSKDDHVIDGHHRWLAAHHLNEPIDTHQVQMNADELIDYLNTQDYTKNISIKESFLAEMTKRVLHKHLESSGWQLSRTSGSHDVFKHPKSNKVIAVPRHKGDLAPGTVRQIQKDSIVEDAAPAVSIGNGAIDNTIPVNATKKLMKRVKPNVSVVDPK